MLPDSTHDEGRPGERAPRNVNSNRDILSANPDGSPDARRHGRRRWAHSLIRRSAPCPPSYGSAEWLALPEGSPEKVAAVVIAAECWAVDGDDLVGRLTRELDEHRAAERRLDERLFVAHVVPMVRSLGSQPGRYANQQVRALEAIGADYARRAQLRSVDDSEVA